MIWRRKFGVQVLTVKESVLIPDSHISIQHTTGTNDWKLGIKDVKPDDAEEYACEVYSVQLGKWFYLK